MGELHVKFVRTRYTIVDYLGAVVGYELKVQALYHGESGSRIVVNDELKYHKNTEAFIDKCFCELETHIMKAMLHNYQSGSNWAECKDGGNKMLQTALVPEYKL